MSLNTFSLFSSILSQNSINHYCIKSISSHTTHNNNFSLYFLFFIKKTFSMKIICLKISLKQTRHCNINQQTLPFYFIVVKVTHWYKNLLFLENMYK